MGTSHLYRKSAPVLEHPHGENTAICGNLGDLLMDRSDRQAALLIESWVFWSIQSASC